MIDAADFINASTAAGHDFYSGVPCSYLTPIIDRLLTDPMSKYVGAANEGEAVAIAAGAWLAGRNPMVMCQNSGLANAINPLVSLNFPFRIPTLVLTTWRGEPGQHDEPQHTLMGKVTRDLLDLMEIPHAEVPSEREALATLLKSAAGEMSRTDMPFALLLRGHYLRKEESLPRPEKQIRIGIRRDWSRDGRLPSRADILQRFLALTDEHTAVIATTGYCGRELFTLSDRKQHLYQVGSMGCASGMALGVALNTQAHVVVLDGDGAALMKLGTFATIGDQAPRNLTHILLDNGAHESTGGQSTAPVDFAAVALACGYPAVATCASLAGFDAAFREAADARHSTFIHVRIASGSMSALGRPTSCPADIARRFRDFLKSERSSSATYPSPVRQEQ